MHTATPYPNARGDRNAYNFYHSQHRMNIECAFGMSMILTRRTFVIIMDDGEKQNNLYDVYDAVALIYTSKRNQHLNKSLICM